MDATVTIGIPVFNGAGTLLQAVESASAQTYGHCIIHISDNASTDATGEIASGLAAKSGNIVYTRHESSLGLMGNFRYPLEHAKTKYFMWLPADDYIEASYVQRMVEELEADPSLVSCVSRVRFVNSDGTSHIAQGTYALLDDPLTNLANFLADPGDNCRSYGLFRTEALLAAFPDRYFHGYDWAFSAGTLVHGKHGEVADVLMVRDETPREKYLQSISRDNKSAITRLFPLLPLTWHLIFRQKIPFDMRVVCALFYMNVAKHVEYIDLFHPSYFRNTKNLWSFWDRYLAWRLLRKARSETVSSSG